MRFSQQGERQQTCEHSCVYCSYPYKYTNMYVCAFVCVLWQAFIIAPCQPCWLPPFSTRLAAYKTQHFSHAFMHIHTYTCIHIQMCLCLAVVLYLCTCGLFCGFLLLLIWLHILVRGYNGVCYYCFAYVECSNVTVNSLTTCKYAFTYMHTSI